MIIERYLEVVRDALLGALQMGTEYVGQIALALGVVFVTGTIAWAFGKREWNFETGRLFRAIGGIVALMLVLTIGTSTLRATRFLAQRDLRARDRAVATSNPVPDAPPVVQSGPAVAVLRERTYINSLTLPPSFLNRLGADGLSALAPYLSNPTSGNVLRLRNSFRRSGRNALFSRQVTILEEKPLVFADSRVQVAFTRLAGRAFNCDFKAHYIFKNDAPQARTVHFLFSLPQAGTVRDLQIRVGAQDLSSESAANSADSKAAMDSDNAQPSDPGTYEWKGEMAPGESREAVVSYAVTGARTWNYDLGSERRRVEAFNLDIDTGGDIGFARGSLQPSSVRGSHLTWQLANVVSAQILALVIPSDKVDKQLFIQALTALPLCLMLFLGGAVALGLGTGAPPSTLRLAGALAIFAVGLGGASVQTFLSPLVMLLITPMVGALGASALLGRRFLIVAIPLALLPATFLSAHYTGILVISLVALTGTATWLATRKTSSRRAV